MISEILSGGLSKPKVQSKGALHINRSVDTRNDSDERRGTRFPAAQTLSSALCGKGGNSPLLGETKDGSDKFHAHPAQKLSDDDELSAWLETLPRKVRFMLAMSVSALSLQRGQCRSRDDLLCFLAAAGLPISRQAIENIESRALRKCRETELAIIAKEHLTTR